MRNGNLPPGIHQASLAQIEQMFANSEHRQNLFKGIIKVDLRKPL